MTLSHPALAALLPLLFGFAVTSAQSQSAPLRPAWIEAPTYADLAAVFPPMARYQNRAGEVTLACRIGDDGRLGRCRVTGENPQGAGFVPAARTLSRRFRVATGGPDFARLRGSDTLLRFVFPLSASGPARVITQPNWAQQPQGGIPGSGYPRAALAAQVESALVILECRVGDGGRLTGCSAARETPAGYGFGEAAVALSSGFVMSLWGDDGLPTVGAMVRVPVRYRLPPPAG